MTACSTDISFDYCSNVADKFYTVTLDGKPYVLKPGLSDMQKLATLSTVAASGGHLILVILNGNVLAHIAPNTPVQIRFHGGGVDVRVLTQTKKGPRLEASHYDIAISQMEPQHHKPPGSH
jgi:hypothetical protein